MPGPAPKLAQQRRRRTPPAGGEWTELPATIDKPILPPLPRRTRTDGPWSAWARDTWEAWRRDPATSQYTAADIRYALDTAYLVEAAHRTTLASLHAEIRLRLDGLGLTAKGKKNLRWRVSESADELARPTRRSANSRRHLRAVDPDAIPEKENRNG